MTREPYLDQPVRSLQTMLSDAALLWPQLSRPAPDGIFGEETLEAVIRFQQLSGLPVTGRVDNDTWDAVVLAYAQARPFAEPPKSLNAFPMYPFSVSPGQSCTHMYVVQAMFQALAGVLEGIERTPINGGHTGASVRNVIWLQRRSGLPETGIVDILTWNKLSRLYELFVVRGDPAAHCRQGSGLSPHLSQGTRGFPWEPYGREG